MTLTGCVVQGEGSDRYMISNMTVGGTGAALHPAGAIYRLDSTKGLKAHVNHKVEISGHADLADIDKGSLETKTNSAGQVETSVMLGNSCS